jgi:hypothetical protein
MSDDSPRRRFPRVVSDLKIGPQFYESLTNAQFIEVYKTLNSLQKKLEHDEFHFVRYLLKMILLELEKQGGRSETPPAPSDNQK